MPRDLPTVIRGAPVPTTELNLLTADSSPVVQEQLAEIVGKRSESSHPRAEIHSQG